MHTVQAVARVEAPAINRSQPNKRKETAVELLGTRPDYYLPTAEELDIALDGKMTKGLENSLIERHCWFSDFLPSLNLWITLCDLVLEGRNPDHGDFEFGPNPSLSLRRKELSGLLVDVLLAYEPAHQESSPYTADWTDHWTATLELLKKFRTYTRCVTALALEVWPDIDLERTF